MSGHDWTPDVRQGSPILRCTRCPIVWWPDRREPKRLCSDGAR